MEVHVYPPIRFLRAVVIEFSLIGLGMVSGAWAQFAGPAPKHIQMVSPYPASRVTQAAPSSFIPPQNVSYYGGPVLSNVQVVVVFWTGNVDAFEAINAEGFYRTVTSSAYMDLLAQYSPILLNGQDGQPGANQVIGRGSYGGAFLITPSVTGTTVDDTQIAAELVHQLNIGALPQPQLDSGGNSNTLYMIYFPPGVTVTLQGMQSCQVFCGYHSTAVYSNTTFNNKPIAYAVIPDESDPSSLCHFLCGLDANYLNNFDTVCSHELAEAVTDPAAGLTPDVARPLGWYDANIIPVIQQQYGEIGDICAFVPAQIGGYMVQQVWSNADENCAASSNLMFTRVLVGSTAPQATVGQPVTFVALVLSSSLVNTGSVTFANGSAALGTMPVNPMGFAVFTTSQLPVGLNKITAFYSRSGNFGASSSGVLNQTVGP